MQQQVFVMLKQLYHGGRTDLVDKQMLDEVKCPCLFIVGGDDKKVIDINKTVEQLSNVKEKELVIVNGASQLFEESGKIEQVAKIASRWLGSYIC